MPHRPSVRTPYVCSPFASEGPAEDIAYVGLAAETPECCDAIGVVDTASGSATVGRLVGRLDFPHGRNQLLGFGWNACSPHGCRHAPRSTVERRYLVVPGTASSRIHIVDTNPDPRTPRLVKLIDGAEVVRRTGYTAPHTVRCGPEGVYVSALGTSGGGGPGGIFTLHPETFEIQERWEKERGPQRLACDFAWHLGHNAMITSGWGTPDMVANGVSAELLLGGKYGSSLHVWDVRTRAHVQAIDLGGDQQMILRLRPAHNPARAYGFAGVMLSLADLSASVFLWYLGRDAAGARTEWNARKVITIRARPADPARLPPLLKDLGAVPPLVTDIALSHDDQWLYVSCWGTGELRRYDVADPFNPVLTGTVRLGGIVRRSAHPGTPGIPRNGAPQMSDVSHDGRRVYVTNAFHSAWDNQFYPDGIRGWMAKVDNSPDGGMVIDPNFLVDFDDGMRPRQVLLRRADGASG